MNNKAKSLLYLGCFILASVFYHVTDNQNETKELAHHLELQQADITIQQPLENFMAQELTE